jgi:hypothetical protein
MAINPASLIYVEDTVMQAKEQYAATSNWHMVHLCY